MHGAAHPEALPRAPRSGGESLHKISYRTLRLRLTQIPLNRPVFTHFPAAGPAQLTNLRS